MAKLPSGRVGKSTPRLGLPVVLAIAPAASVRNVPMKAPGLFPGYLTGRRRSTRLTCDWSSDVCSSDLSTRHNIGASIGEKVSVKKVEASEADEIVVSPTEKLAIEGLDEYMLTNYEGH